MSDEIAYRDALPPGTRLREFELLEVLGRGGFGITYRGWYPNLGVNVAIKEYMPSEFAVRESNGDVYPKTHQSEEWYRWGLAKFRKEAETLLRFNHPSIVRVLQYFEGHGTAYMVMEYLEGQTLFALLHEQKTLSEARLRALLVPILDGLEQVHTAEYLHRDIKPGNIVLRDEDTPVLIDFGAAYALTAEHSRTVAAFEMPGFSPIEQYSVSGQNYGPWTDLYAVGAVLYRAMTELVPVGALSRIERDDLAPVGRVAKRKYSKELTGAVDWALKLRAADRPQSIAQWRRVLEGRSRPPGPVDGPTARGSRKLLATIVMAATLLVAAGAWWTIEPNPDVETIAARVRALVEEGEIPEARRILEEARVLGLPDEQYQALSDAIDQAHVDPPPDDDSIERKIARVRELVDEGEIAQARRVLEEARVLGLDDEQYQALSDAIDQAHKGAAPLLAQCQSFKSERRWDEALVCVRQVLAADPDNAEARDEERNLEMLVAFSTVHDEPTVEGWFEFIKNYPWSPFVDAATEGLRELESPYWEEVKATDTPERYRRYLEIYPEGRYVREARRRLSGEG